MWGFVIECDHPSPNEFWVVFDTLVSPVPGHEEYRANSVTKIRKAQVVQVIHKDKRRPMLHIRVAPEDGSITCIRRIDGRREPMTVQVDRGTASEFYMVTPQGWEEVH